MKTYKTAEYSFSISRPSYAGNSVKLAYFTDMHNCCSPKEAEELEGRLFSLEPDLVLCGGDSIIARPGEPVERSVKKASVRLLPDADGQFSENEYSAV